MDREEALRKNNQYYMEMLENKRIRSIADYHDFTADLINSLQEPERKKGQCVAVCQLEAEIESSDKYIREYDDSEMQKAYNKGLRDALKSVINCNEECPFVAKGQWVNGTCTECGQVDFSKPNYCPNCGADMRKGEGE